MTLPIRTREEAHAAGLVRYYTGKPCHKGHDCERYVSSGGCIDCVSYKAAPKKREAANLAWPSAAFLFITPCTREEMQAALRYVAHMRWHETALAELRKDPALMAQFVVSVTPDELAKARATINAHELAQARDSAKVL